MINIYLISMWDDDYRTLVESWEKEFNSLQEAREYARELTKNDRGYSYYAKEWRKRSE